MAAVNPPSRAGRLPGLDVIRGLAATAVAIYHLMMLYVPLPAGPVRSIVGTWSGAVPLFFALSAFSLLLGYAGKCWDEAGLRRFYLRRVFRIFPLFYFMLAAYLALSAARGLYVSSAEILLNLSFLFPFFPGKHESLVWAGWSLGVEVCFYTLFPITALLSRWLAASAAGLLGLGALTVAATTVVGDLALPRSYGGMSLPANLVYFLAGVVAFALTERAAQAGKARRTVDWLVRWGMPLVALSMLALFVHKFMPWAPMRKAVPKELLLALACGLWIVVAYGGLPRWLDTAATRFLGKLSYGIYLVHPLVLWSLHQSGVYGVIGEGIADPHLAFLACAALTLPLVVALAELGYRLVESPGMALGERLIARFRGDARPLASPT